VARNRQFEAVAINVTMHPHSANRYVELFETLARLRIPAAVREEYRATIGTARPLHEDDPRRGLTGEIYKYFELDQTSRWCNVVKRQTADDQERSSIQIPEDLKPHFSFFYYVFFPRNHRLVYESKYGQSRLTPSAAEKMLNTCATRRATACGTRMATEILPRCRASFRCTSFGHSARRMPMSMYRKTADAVARLTPEQYRVTQKSGIEAPEAASFWITMTRVST
jgi:hypothetical protein